MIKNGTIKIAARAHPCTMQTIAIATVHRARQLWKFYERQHGRKIANNIKYRPYTHTHKHSQTHIFINETHKMFHILVVRLLVGLKMLFLSSHNRDNNNNNSGRFFSLNSFFGNFSSIFFLQFCFCVFIFRVILYRFWFRYLYVQRICVLDFGHFFFGVSLSP